MVKILWKIKETGLRIKETLEDKQGIGVVEVILILVVLIGVLQLRSTRSKEVQQ